MLSEQSPHAVRAVNWIGRNTPAYCTSAGKALLLDRSPAELAALFEGRTFLASAPGTPGSVAELAKAIGAARERGYAIADEEMDAGLTAAAAPVRDGSGRIVAAINVTAVNAHIDEQAMHGALKDSVLEAAGEISRWLANRR